MPGEGTQLLVLAPSQKLAIQTTKVIREWATLIGVSVQSLTGGKFTATSYEFAQTLGCRGGDTWTGTPYA